MRKAVATSGREVPSECLPACGLLTENNHWPRKKESPDLPLVLTEVVRMFNAINFQALNVLTLRASFKESNARCKHFFFHT